MVIDGETVITGSFNFAKAAEENNAENLLAIRDRKLAERYTKSWQEHESHSEVYVGKGGQRVNSEAVKPRGNYAGNNGDFSEVLYQLGKIKGNERQRN